MLPVFRDDGDMSFSGMADTCCCCPREECRAVLSACIRDCRDTLLLPVSRMAEPYCLHVSGIAETHCCCLYQGWQRFGVACFRSDRVMLLLTVSDTSEEIRNRLKDKQLMFPTTQLCTYFNLNSKLSNRKWLRALVQN